jgi:hypothetical protein
VDISKLLAALVASAGVHTGGHIQEGAERGIPMSVHQATEVWREKKHPDNMPGNRWGIPYENPDLANESAIHGAGFAAQDKLKNAVDTPEANVATGFYKALYPFTQKIAPGQGVRGGDIGGMERASGNKYVGEMVAASAIHDLLKGFGVLKNKGNLNFKTVNGTPALLYEGKF